MTQRTTDLLVYVPLAVATAAYAAILDRFKPVIEPDWTWAEVVAGTALCLAAAEIRARLGPDGRAEALRAVHLAFRIGGAPIILWQLGRMVARRRRAGRALQRYHRE